MLMNETEIKQNNTNFFLLNELTLERESNAKERLKNC